MSALLGHANLATTQRYVALYNHDAVEAVQLLPDPRASEHDQARPVTLDRHH